MKSPGRIIEEYAGWAAFVIGFVVACFISPEKYHYSELINGFPVIGLGIFGFMLTFIAIILQSSNNTIDYMKSQETLFKCFVDYNKRVVFVSAILTLYAYLISSFCIPVDCINWVIGGITVQRLVKIAAISLFWGLLFKLCVDTFFFIRSFYILLRK